MHPREQVIRSMARTLIVESFASWADENGEKAKPYVARGGQDWMDTTPAMTPECREAALIEAAVLYGAIKQVWRTEPWILVQGHTDKHGVSHERDFKEWGHYAVMTCLGHGVTWEDSNTPLEDFSKSYTLLSQHNFDIPRIESLDWEWADEAAKAQGLLQGISVLRLSTYTLGILYENRGRLIDHDHNIMTVGDLLQCRPNSLLRLKGFGRTRLREVQKALEPYRR